MAHDTLNLARKWRSKNFEQLIGQELIITMLKNSLYRDQFFPVYLFAGQRGCGKTSTARVFAAAVNCEKLPLFRERPKEQLLPCLTCFSCTAMAKQEHPDFIEIDAASHTGVDNVRDIIDAATFLPLVGRKKIYLIDEAHMLSRAAFNAFLKILEEPPASVLFILATTELLKIVDTVRSRCFQLFFKPVVQTSLISHLRFIAQQENVVIDDEAIELIAQESGGSVRDALNLLEQVRFSAQVITKEVVLSVFGHIDDEQCIHLAAALIEGSVQTVLAWVAAVRLHERSLEFVWYRLLDLMKDILWVQHQLPPKVFVRHHEALRKLAAKMSLERWQYIVSTFCDQETVFLRSAIKQVFFESLLVQLCMGKKKKGSGGNDQGPASELMLVAKPPVEQEVEEEQEIVEEETKAVAITAAAPTPQPLDGNAQRWHQFVLSVEALKEPLVSTIFKSGMVKAWDTVSGNLEVLCAKKFSFLADALTTTESLWLPLLQQAFDTKVRLVPAFTEVGAVTNPVVRPPALSELRLRAAEPAKSEDVDRRRRTDGAVQPSAQAVKSANAWGNYARSAGGQSKAHAGAIVYPGVKLTAFDEAHVEQWPQLKMVHSYFPGKIFKMEQQAS